MRFASSLALGFFACLTVVACGGSTDIAPFGAGGAGGAGGASSATTSATTSSDASSSAVTASATSSVTSTGVGGSGGSGGTMGFCGDGAFDANEGCDDGNQLDGDGCSVYCFPEDGWTCLGQPSACFAVCGDGVLVGDEACDDDNTTAGDGCSGVCLTEVGWSCGGEPSVCATDCGDGLLFGAEQCDDSNLGDGDGCSGSCVIEAGYSCAGEPSVCVASCGDGLVGVGEGCDDGANLPGDGCATDCTVEPFYVCTGSPSVCGPLCGDGVLFLGETCDDGNTTNGDGCTSACVENQGYDCTGTPSVCAPVCGDGITLSPETCDDGNNADLDGCSAGCLFEGALNEIEVNDTTADADASPLQLTGSGVVSGAIGVVGDKDFFRLTLASDRVVRFETAETLSPFDCPNLTTTLRLYDSAGVELYFSNTAGIESCSALVLGLSAGTYYVSVEEAGNNGTIAQYYLDVALHADLGSELESNDSMATANAFLGTNVVLSGSHQDGAESDYYLIDIPTSGWSVRAETLEAVGGETCESNGMDTRVSLYDVPGNPFISDDDDAGRGACSRMDGTGGQPSNTGSHDLAAGLYYVRVRAATGAQNDASGQFDYRVALTLRSP